MKLFSFWRQVQVIEVEAYPLKGDAPKIALKIAEEITPQKKEFKLFFLSPPMFDAESLRERAKEIASETSRLVGRNISYQGGEVVGEGEKIFLDYKIL